MNSIEALEKFKLLYENKCKSPNNIIGFDICYATIKQDLEDYLIIKEIEDNVCEGKRVIIKNKKYYACEFILAEEGTIRYLTILCNNHKRIVTFEDYKKSWKFED